MANARLQQRRSRTRFSILQVDGGKVTYNKLDMLVGLFPYNVAVTPNGSLAITSNNGNAGSSDGNIDTAGVIDLTANPPREIDQVVVGDGPEGLAISPKGNIAVSVILRGSNNKNAFFYHRNGSVSVLRIDGKKVTKTQDIEVGGLPEAAVFTPDGKYLLIGNYLDSDFSILKVNGNQIVDTGKRFKVPGHPGIGPHEPTLSDIKVVPGTLQRSSGIAKMMEVVLASIYMLLTSIPLIERLRHGGRRGLPLEIHPRQGGPTAGGSVTIAVDASRAISAFGGRAGTQKFHCDIRFRPSPANRSIARGPLR